MRSLDVPFFKQHTDYTCGPASLQMMLGFQGIFASEKELKKKLKTNTRIGTRHSHLVHGLRSYGLKTYVNHRSHIDELKQVVWRGNPAVIHMIEPEANWCHYVVVIGVRRKYVICHDPWQGAQQRLGIEEFVQRWACPGHIACTKWLLTAEPPQPSAEGAPSVYESKQIVL